MKAIDTEVTDQPLDRLRSLAEHGPDAKLRAAAKAELERRMAAAQPEATAPARRVEVGSSVYGTPQPRVVVEIAWCARPERELRAQMHEVAAQVERALAETREAWPVELGRLDELAGAVYLELMDGFPREVERASALLSAVVGAMPPGGQPPKPRRKRDLQAERERRKARAAQGAAGSAACEPAVPAPANDAVPVAAPHGSEREARRAYRQLAGDEAAAFEEQLLAGDRDRLPAHAVAVLNGGRRGAEYWTWLHQEYAAAQRGSAS